MQEVKDEFDTRGVAVVVVSFAAPERLVPYQQVHQWQFPLLADPERAAYSYFGLKRLPWYRLFSPSTLKLYLHLLWQGRKLQSYGSDDYYQSGGDFLLDRNGTLLFAHRSHDPADRPTVKMLLENIDASSRHSRGSGI
ncbi:MAG: redoxin domain-containing protein [Deltaproteobacteria bacterium]|nr:redoxin domain-containing protein [Deltaproteobacteria bacterium]